MNDEATPTPNTPDFGYLKQIVPRETVEYELFELEGIAGTVPVLLVRALADNEKYLGALKDQRSDMERRVRQLTRTRRGRRRISEAEGLELLAAVDREIYAGTVVVGWKGVPDVSRKPVPWSVENCRAFLKALPDSMFITLRNFVGDTSNFQTSVDGGPDDATEELAKN